MSHYDIIYLIFYSILLIYQCIFCFIVLRWGDISWYRRLEEYVIAILFIGIPMLFSYYWIYHVKLINI